MSADAWLEYLAWCRGADPDEYVRTEQLAWERLERALIAERFGPSSPPSYDPPPRA